MPKSCPDQPLTAHRCPTATPTWLLPSLALLFAFSVLNSWLWLAPERASAQPGEADRSPLPPTSDYLAVERRAMQVFEAVSPSVVFVRTSNIQRTRDLFGRTVREQERAVGSGSGFVWDDAGHVVTNYHVIRPAFDRTREGALVQDGTIIVQLADGNEHVARVIGAAAYKDIAVLKLDDVPAADLEPVIPAASSDLRVGQQVYAIGSPFGLDQTLTTGIVSALGRSIPSVAGPEIEGVIQTDAAINPGSSGGPLLDSLGRLIGINTAIRSPSGASAGIGFAVPSDTVTHLVPQLIEFGRVTRPTLGILVVPDSYTRRLGLNGVLVQDVSPGSGAERAGLRGLSEDARGMTVLGDLIIEINDRPVGNLRELEALVEQYAPGDTVQVTVQRIDPDRDAVSTLSLQVTLGEPVSVE